MGDAANARKTEVQRGRILYPPPPLLNFLGEKPPLRHTNGYSIAEILLVFGIIAGVLIRSLCCRNVMGSVRHWPGTDGQAGGGCAGGDGADLPAHASAGGGGAGSDEGSGAQASAVASGAEEAGRGEGSGVWFRWPVRFHRKAAFGGP